MQLDKLMKTIISLNFNLILYLIPSRPCVPNLNRLVFKSSQRFNKSTFDTNKVVASKFLAVNLNLCGLLIHDFDLKL
ncbi:hypothetical protein BpHYR1_045653 [Brachionus plicatilis]|uniref:Uncharacterized protein n=1 Tax=Brachionus plicatilis TaxID=10195 RepID=A0A3M7PEK5_BRAPC|nr:hypothetical protein BpHYR1_045653 [Brachionus plicatilis]